MPHFARAIGGRVVRAVALCAIVCPAYLATAANAAPITDPSALSPRAVLIDFEDIDTAAPLPNPRTLGIVTFTSVTGMLSILDISASGWPADGTEVASKTLFPGGEPDSAISITFAHPVAQFLLGWGDPNFSGNVLRAFGRNGQLLEEAAVALGPTGGVHAAWIGFSRRTPDIAMILVQPAQPLPSGDDYVIDNIRYNTRPVPAPSALLLLASGLVGIVAWQRRCLKREGKAADPDDPGWLWLS